MSTENDPRALLDLYERRTLARLKGTAHDLGQRPSEQVAPLLDWVREHPRTSVTAAAAGGFLLAPRRGAGSHGERFSGIRRLARTGRVLVYGRVMRALSDAVGLGGS